jgi:cullin 4
VSQAVRVLLNRGADSWPWAYDHIYNACRSLVTYHGQGEGLHSNIRLALEQCVSALAKGLDSKQGDEMQWTEAFNETCDWFVKRVVSN